MCPLGTIEDNLNVVNGIINDTLKANQRPQNTTKLIAVSKTKPPGLIEQALKAGQRLFGENRVQESEEKWIDLKKEYPDTELHLIGPLQTNKALIAVSLFDVIQTIDRIKLAKTVARHMNDTGRRPACFVQVNTGREPQKAGVLPEDADDFIQTCRSQLQLPIGGLMCIPPINEEPALHFSLLRKLVQRNGLKRLSMGMSSDFVSAITFGSTDVRVGSAIFGQRT